MMDASRAAAGAAGGAAGFVADVAPRLLALVVTGMEGSRMSSSRKVMTAMTGGVVVVLLLAFVALTGMSASFAWTEGGGYGSGPGICQTATTTPDTGFPTPGISGTTPYAYRNRTHLRPGE